MSGLDRDAQEWLVFKFGLIPARHTPPGLARIGGFPDIGYLTFLSSTFLHGSFLHLLSNIWTLWLFGDNVEDRLGPFRYFLLYVVSGVAANLLHLYTNLGSPIPVIGASGAIAGVMGAYFLLYPRARIITLVPVLFFPLILEIPAFFFLLIWLLTQLAYALRPVGPLASGGVAWWAHVGGFLAGLVGLVILKSTCHQRRCYEDEYRPW